VHLDRSILAIREMLPIAVLIDRVRLDAFQAGLHFLHEHWTGGSYKPVPPEYCGCISTLNTAHSSGILQLKIEQFLCILWISLLFLVHSGHQALRSMEVFLLFEI